eukprot:364418-Chlamydomonas_euryale.AAC.2
MLPWRALLAGIVLVAPGELHCAQPPHPAAALAHTYAFANHLNTCCPTKWQRTPVASTGLRLRPCTPPPAVASQTKRGPCSRACKAGWRTGQTVLATDCDIDTGTRLPKKLFQVLQEMHKWTGEQPRWGRSGMVRSGARLIAARRTRKESPEAALAHGRSCVLLVWTCSRASLADAGGDGSVTTPHGDRIPSWPTMQDREAWSMRSPRRRKV